MKKLLAEFIGTFWLVLGGCGSAVLAAGFHLISIPVTNTSVNPAKSTSQTILAAGIYLQQLWLFWAAPLIGAVLAGFLYNYLSPTE